MRYDNPELREALAAEYVLGTMPTRSRRRLEWLIARDPAWAQVIDAWADRLAPIDAAMPSEQPPLRVWRAIEARIGGRPVSPTAEGWLGSLVFWRGLAVAGCAAAAALVIYIAAFSGRIGPPTPIVLAVLADQNGDPSWIATAGPQKGEFRFRRSNRGPRTQFIRWSCGELRVGAHDRLDCCRSSLVPAR